VLGLGLLTGDVGDELVAAHPDGPVDLPQRHDDVVAAQRPVPGQGVLVVTVDEGAVDVEDDRVKHGYPLPQWAHEGGRQ
jgi:hypothetical protein